MHIYTCTCRIHIDAVIKTSEDFFKNIPLSLFERFVCEMELETEQNFNILTSPALPDIAVCCSRSPSLLLNRRAGGPFFWMQFSLPHLVPNSSDLQLNRGPEGPFCRVVAFSTTSCLRLSDLQLTDFLSSPSYIIVQSRTQSLEWHVWSSSSWNYCHAVHWSLSSGASVYECTMGFYLVPYRQPSRLRDFFS